MALFSRIFGYLDCPWTWLNPNIPSHRPGAVRGELRFEDVSYTYPELTPRLWTR